MARKRDWRNEPGRYRKPNRLCECGNLCDTRDEACARCSFLDGTPYRRRDFRLVQVFRDQGFRALTVNELAGLTGRDRTSIERTLLGMLRAGRVMRFIADNEWCDNIYAYRLHCREDDAFQKQAPASQKQCF